jgi:putative radical SAM enzyme (TIGR03279 family)
MRKIINVIKKSPAHRARIRSGDVLVSINNHEINDVLDYMFFCADKELRIRLENREVLVKKSEYEDLGLEFDSFLMSESRNCKNKCIFCFIDQMPPGLRETLYFKDDDSRLSFLQGNYISLTNLTEREVKRIIEMRLSVNVSVHTTARDLRVKMLGNPNAGSALDYLYQIAGAGVEINCQIVLCPGINDGLALEKTLTDLSAFPSIKSIACVPVGLTKYREGLTELKAFDRESARNALDIIGKYKNVYASDELYLIAERDLPDYEHYDDFPQYENGVGMLRLLEHEFGDGKIIKGCKRSIATGVLAAPFIERLVKKSGADVRVFAIRNDFFGHNVTVVGLVTGNDLIAQLLPYKNELGEELLIPKTMLRANDDVFLDDVCVGDVCSALGVRVRVVEVDGFELYNALK